MIIGVDLDQQGGIQGAKMVVQYRLQIMVHILPLVLIRKLVIAG